MYLKIFFSLLISISAAHAGDIKLSYGLFNYHYSSAPELLQMKGKRLNLKLSKNECNKGLVKSFEGKISRTLEAMVRQKSPLPEGMEVSFGDEKTYQSNSSPAGKFFLGLPSEFKKLISADRFKCGKK